VSWFDVAETPDGRSYSVAAYRAGTSTALTGGVPGAVSGGLRLLLLPYIWVVGPVVWVVARIRFRHTWTVRIAPWYGHRGKRWKVRVPTEPVSDRRANALFQLINTGQWDPELEPPPEPASVE
jgi:hypothetical protein